MDPVVFALVAAGMGALWWRHARQYQRPARALGSMFDPDAEVALHVATHEARTRGEPLSSLHVLYGLLQDEAITAALRVTGADPSALEDRVLAALGDARPPGPDGDEDAQRVYGHAAGHASHANRRASCIDLWAYLRGSAAAGLLADGDATVGTVLFQLCHGTEPAPRLDGVGDVYVVLRNDDYTTQQFVCRVLEDVFELPADAATARMLETHREGRSVIGRYRPDDARAKIEETRRRARAGGFPLWIAPEPA